MFAVGCHQRKIVQQCGGGNLRIGQRKLYALAGIAIDQFTGQISYGAVN